MITANSGLFEFSENRKKSEQAGVKYSKTDSTKVMKLHTLSGCVGLPVNLESWYAVVTVIHFQKHCICGIYLFKIGVRLGVSVANVWHTCHRNEAAAADLRF